jgi:hypothetical protein
MLTPGIGRSTPPTLGAVARPTEAAAPLPAGAALRVISAVAAAIFLAAAGFVVARSLGGPAGGPTQLAPRPAHHLQPFRREPTALASG